MRKGFVFGKFMPLHKGHIGLFDFAKNRCDFLFIIVCASNNETIDGEIRKYWVEHVVKDTKNIQVILFGYNEAELPNTSVSNENVSVKWANAFMKILPDVDVVFTSEPYGDYIAQHMNIEHEVFDINRKAVPISSSLIRTNSFRNWEFIPAIIRPYFIKKLIILGTESTGKSEMSKRLASHFQTDYVPEMAREIIEHTEECTYEHLKDIAELHANEINKKVHTANKLLFVDTDINITRFYSRYLFSRDLIVDDWIYQANKGDFYIFLEADCKYVQDGSRLSEGEREKLNTCHKEMLAEERIEYITITGEEWNDRFEKAKHFILERVLL